MTHCLQYPINRRQVKKRSWVSMIEKDSLTYLSVCCSVKCDWRTEKTSTVDMVCPTGFPLFMLSFYSTGHFHYLSLTHSLFLSLSTALWLETKDGRWSKMHYRNEMRRGQMRLEFLGGPIQGLYYESKSNDDPYLNRIMKDTNAGWHHKKK